MNYKKLLTTLRSTKNMIQVSDSKSENSTKQTVSSNQISTSLEPKLDQSPFFIVGCVRSGTTMLRDFFRLAEELESPEETHFFRDADPYATPNFIRRFTKNGLLKKHREMDGVTESDFEEILFHSVSRRDMMDKYMNLFIQAKGKKNARWYDKTPQHVYGIFLLQYYYPESKFIHIVRNPLNVAASLKLGKVMPEMSVIAAINYWNEAMVLMRDFKSLYGHKLFEFRYEDFLEAPNEIFTDLLEFVGEDSSLELPPKSAKKESNKYLTVLTEEEIQLVKEHCGEFMESFGYL